MNFQRFTFADRTAELIERFPDYAEEYPSFIPTMRALVEFLDGEINCHNLYSA